MASGIFGAALVATAFAIAGIIVGAVDTSFANTLCNAVSGPLSNLVACEQARNVGTTAYLIGGAALVIAVVLWFMVLKESS